MIKKVNSLARIITKHPLKNKVVLLLNGTELGGRSLVMSLAKYGADIAIIYRQTHTRRAREIKSSVEAEGRRCLIIQAQTADETFPKEVVRQTVESLGRLDIFIDYSSLPNDRQRRDNNADTA